MQPDTPRHSVSVAAAVVDAEGRILRIRRRDNDQWEPPGGVLELGESIHEGLVREVHEETGLTVEPGPLTGIYKNMERGHPVPSSRAWSSGCMDRPAGCSASTSRSCGPPQ